jgi:hypothetical protein
MTPKPGGRTPIRLQVFDSVLQVFWRQRGMNQYETSQHFSDAARLRVAVRDAHVGYTGRMETEKVNVLGDNNASCLGREC